MLSRGRRSKDFYYVREANENHPKIYTPKTLEEYNRVGCYGIKADGMVWYGITAGKYDFNLCKNTNNLFDI